MKKQLLILTTVILSISAFAQVPNYVPTNGLVGWWPFNGNANDESGNGNNGTVNGATLTANRFGNANNAFVFDGVDDIISVYDNNSLDFPNGQFSISIWVKVGILNTEMSFIDHLDNGSPSIYSRYEIRKLPNNKVRFVLKDMSSVFSYIDSDSLINDENSWYHIVGTFDSNTQTIKLFVNGSNQIGQTTLQGTSNSITPPGQLQFGRYGEGPFSNATLDDIGIWNRALTQCEIQDLYNAELNSLAVSGGLDQTLCEGQSTSLFGSGANTYSWSNNVTNGVGFVPTATTNYIVTGTDANGCLGADTVTIVVNANTSSTQTQSALDSYTWPVNGQTYTQSGTYTDTLVNAAGCDSIVTLNLTISYTGIEEIQPNSSKKLLRITDLSGKETPFRKNTVLLFIYEDGTVERVYVGE